MSLKHPKLLWVVGALVVAWYGFVLCLPDIGGCRLPIQQAGLISILRTHMLAVARGAKFDDLSWLTNDLASYVVPGAGYRIARIKADDGNIVAIVGYPVHRRVLRHGWAACVFWLRCERVDLPAYALLPDGRLFKGLAEYSADSPPDAMKSSQFASSEDWVEVNRYEFTARVGK